MVKKRLPAFAAATMIAVSSPLAAQDNAIGPPDLRDFSLPGTRTTPAAPVQRVDPPPPPIDPPAERQPTATRPRPAAPTSTPAPAATPAPTRQAPAPTPTPEPVEPAEPDPAPTPPVTTAPSVQPVPQSDPAPPPAEPVPTPQDRDWILWAAAGAGAALFLLGAALLLRRRRRTPIIADSAMVEPVPLPPPPPPPPPPPRPQPRIEVDFRPERLVATDGQAAVHFELTLRNHGDAPARNLRIEARLFNASGAETRDVQAFFSAPVDAANASAGLALAPGRGAQLTSAVTMPRDRMRAVELGGRPLFIPTVAVKIVHDGEGGEDVAITRRYLVGIEPKEPAGKMGPFRMDIGPRIYRSVGQRPIAA